jgi:hypothetical protein
MINLELFRLDGAVKRDPDVARWFAEDPQELQSIAQAWFTLIRQCGNDVRELMHDGCPTACVEDAAFAYVDSFTSHVNVGFFYGAFLEDPAGLLIGSGKRMRHVKLAPGRPFNDEALRGLIGAAYKDIRARLAAEQSSREK